MFYLAKNNLVGLYIPGPGLLEVVRNPSLDFLLLENTVPFVGFLLGEY